MNKTRLLSGNRLMWTATLLMAASIASCSDGSSYVASDTGAPDTATTDDTSDPGSDAPGMGCSAPTQSQVRVLEQVTVGDTSRAYRLSIPATDAGTRLPVLLAFQGGDGGDYPFPQQDEFNALVASQKFIMVSPIAELLPPNEGAWQLNTREGFTQDVDFVAAILDQLSAQYCVDPKRVYATGYSLGSMFTYELPCHLSERFAAIASFAGSMPVNPASCDGEPLAIMHIHGLDDWLIPYDEQWDWKEWDTVGTMRDIPGLIAFWSEQYNCRTQGGGGSDADVHLVHSDCDGDVRVEHHGLAGVEHDWPAAIDGTPTAQVVWDFVSAFSKP